MGGRGPRKFAEVIAIASAYGLSYEADGGKHNYRFTRDGFGTFTIPAHNGTKTEISFVYIQSLCRNMGIPIEAFTEGATPAKEPKVDREAERAAERAAKQAAAYAEKMAAEQAAAEAAAAEQAAMDKVTEVTTSVPSDGVPYVSRAPTPRSGPGIAPPSMQAASSDDDR